MQLYSIMPLIPEHLDEICTDVAQQYESGISTCALFMVKLVPEGNPPIDKAGAAAAAYSLFRDRLAAMGLSCGILVQCSIGHGYPLNQPMPFTRYVNLTDGRTENVCCPCDDAARDYFRQQMARLAALRPAVIMLDDDFRLMYRDGKGCACPLHLRAFADRVGETVEREALFAALRDPAHPDHRRFTDAYVDTQRESLLLAAQAMREGIDAVDPALPGIFCSVGHTTEFGAEIARIMAGRGNPAVVRINNGSYTPAGARGISVIAYRCAQQREVLRRGGVDVVLAETDTCPQNRYSTGAQSLHAHFTASLLEGAGGAKHWITRLRDHEPRSGAAYRKILARNRGFYAALADLVPTLAWQGCRIPLPTVPDYGFTHHGWYTPRDGWSSCVLERMGIPLYFSAEPGGAVCLEGRLQGFSDDELAAFCRGPMLVASDAAEALCARGFGGMLGAALTEWQGPAPSGERMHLPDRVCDVQPRLRRLIPQADTVRIESTVYHLRDGVEQIPLFPAVTVYDNPAGGRAVTFAGSPDSPFHFSCAFSFLNESRKAQLVGLLREAGCLPVWYEGDEEVYLKAARTPSGALLCALFNVGLDPIDEIVLRTDAPVRAVSRLTPDGARAECAFRRDGERLTVALPLPTLAPVILFLHP